MSKGYKKWQCPPMRERREGTNYFDWTHVANVSKRVPLGVSTR